MATDDTLNPTQRRTLATLGAGDPGARTEFDPHLSDRLRDRLDQGLGGLLDDGEDRRPLTIAKHLLNGVHGCQARYLDEEARPFEPSVPVVRGTIVHKALELAIHWPEAIRPLDLVDEAIARIGTGDHWATDYVASMTPGDHAELRAAAGGLLSAFVETWPPLGPMERPVTEARMWAEVCGGLIRLKGQADLTIGQPVGSGTRARKIIVDYKTGGRSPEHRNDLRFYALVETLRTGVPPRLLVTAYLAGGTLETEPVTENILEATAARVVDGVAEKFALDRGEHEPIRRPSFACTWCPLLHDCEIGQAHLAEAG